MKLPLDYTPRTLEARPLIQGKPGFPDYVEYFVGNVLRRVVYTKFGVHIKNKRNKIYYKSA